jgi:hypothetical protein
MPTYTVFSKEIINPPPESYTSSSNSNNQQHEIDKMSVGNQHKFAQQNHSKKFKASDDSEDNFGSMTEIGDYDGVFAIALQNMPINRTI